ncbi:MAG: hypothetical protein AAFW98_10810 [Pseudomonadota bacterium]
MMLNHLLLGQSLLKRRLDSYNTAHISYRQTHTVKRPAKKNWMRTTFSFFF